MYISFTKFFKNWTNCTLTIFYRCALSSFGDLYFGDVVKKNDVLVLRKDTRTWTTHLSPAKSELK